jgi:hypothetical protein
MTSLLRLTALRQLNLTDSLEMTPGRLAQLGTLSTLHVLCLHDCFDLKAWSRPPRMGLGYFKVCPGHTV